MTELDLVLLGSLHAPAFEGTDGFKESSVKETFVDSAVGSTTAESSSSQSPSIEKAELMVKDWNTTVKLEIELKDLYSVNSLAKIWRVAVQELEKENALSTYPHTVPLVGPTPGKYDCREADFWTCGFFPGSMYALLERSIKYPQAFPFPTSNPETFRKEWLNLCRAWTVPIHAMATRTDTHDMAFIIEPSLRMDWELTGNKKSLQSILMAAESLASRWSESAGAIRSWDVAINNRYSFTDMDSEFLVIIDSMCNLDLLYYAGNHTKNQRLIDIATAHAHTVLRALVRPDHSTYHLVNLEPKTGAIKDQLTNQGHKDWSTWSRGQAWAILGYAQTYMWTKNPVFLQAARDVTDYFIKRLKESEHAYTYVPLWDFDAPIPQGEQPLRDTSAGMIAANGMLVLHQVLQAQSGFEGVTYLEYAMRITSETIELALPDDLARFDGGTELKVNEGSYDAILMHATANNNEDAHMPYKDHGLVYADYYFLEFGNKLLRMGLV